MSYDHPTGSVVVYQIIPSSLLTGASIIGRPPVAVTNTPSISGTVDVNPTSVLVLNPVSILAVNQSGTRITSLVSTIPSSVIVGVSIFGQLPAGSAPLGSVATLQGTNPWITNFQNSSILAVPVGSTIAIIQANSIAGTYAEDSGHTTADRGLFVLGVRNDAVASFVGANLEYSPKAVDSAGRTIVKPFAADDTATFNYQGSVVSGSVTLIKASAVGLRNYLTDFAVANTGSVATLITFQDGSTSIVGRTIAPAGGGSNKEFQVALKTNPSQDLTFVVGTSTSILYMTVTGYQAP